MSDFIERHEKLAVHLQELYSKHRALDDEVKKLYTSFATDEKINRKKTAKLWSPKMKSYRLETELKSTMKKLTNIDKKLHWTTFWSEKLPAVIGALTMLVLGVDVYNMLIAL